MKSITISQGFGISNIQISEQPKPSLEPDKVLVKIQAVSLNWIDLLVVKGFLNPNLSLPYIPATDGAGIVESVGENVTEFKPGDKVATLFIPNWVSGLPTPKAVDFATRPGLGNVAGQLIEYKTFKVNELIKSPSTLSEQEASTLPIAGLTAWNALRYGNLKAGDTVLLHGTGGVSIFALQFAKAFGARVIITSSSDSKLARVQQLGADLTINYKTTPDWETKVNYFTDGSGVDVVVETVGGKNLQKSINALRMGGHISVMGLLDGLDINFTTLSLLAKQATIKGMEVGNTSDFELMNKAIIDNNIHPVIDKVFFFDQVQEAFEYLDRGLHFGKVVITI